MTTYLVVGFKDEKDAFRGSEALKTLHRNGSITAYDGVVVEKMSSGEFEIKAGQTDSGENTLFGMMTGSLMGLLGGPAGLVLGSLSGTAVGALADMAEAGVDIEFADTVARQMEAGNFAVIAEVDEYWTTAIDTRMDELGGTVYRRDRIDVVDAQDKRHAEARMAEATRIKQEKSQTSAERKENLQAKAKELNTKMAEAQEKMRSSFDKFEADTKAKINKISEQIKTSSDERKAEMTARKAAHEAKLTKRRELLGEAKSLYNDASNLVKEAYS